MKIKMIVSDLDGTLLREDKSISEHTKSVLNKCRQAGIKVVYATGRGGSANERAPAALFDGRISMNGAIAIVGDKMIYNPLVPYQLGKPVLIACDKRNLKTTSEAVDGKHYSNFDVIDEWPSLFESKFEIVDFEQHNIDAAKLYAVVNTPEDAAYIQENLPPELYLTVSRDGLAQVMHKDATKSKAIAELAKLWRIDSSEIAAFGDDLNDLDMLDYAGYGVAMGNAVDDVKTACDFECGCNDEDGLAKWIETNVLHLVVDDSDIGLSSQ